MYEIKVISGFSSAHKLRGYKGKCEALHGHNWKVEVYAACLTLDKTGMVADFKQLKSALSKVLKRLDHAYINNLPYFKRVNPTSENIARYILEQVQSKLKKTKISRVTVWESDSSSASYFK